MTASSALDALDRILALRPDDVDPLDFGAAAPVPADERMGIEADDAFLAEAIDAWAAADLGVPSFTAADIFARAANDQTLTPSPLDGSHSASPGAEALPTSIGGGRSGPITGSIIPSWLVPVALAASLAAAAFGVWRFGAPASDLEDARPKSMVSNVSATRVALQFSVEGPEGVVPGRNGASYGPEESLAFRFDVAGESGFVALLEVGEQDWSVLYPLDGGTLAVGEGAHVLSSDSGAPLVYRPEDPTAGTLNYVAVVLSEPVDLARVVPGLLSAGLHRADLWPRPVVAVDAVTVTWEGR